MATDETQTGRKKINPLQIHQSGKNKKMHFLSKKITKSFGNNYLMPIFAVSTTAVVTGLNQLKQLKINNLKLQNYGNKKSLRYQNHYL